MLLCALVWERPALEEMAVIDMDPQKPYRPIDLFFPNNFPGVLSRLRIGAFRRDLPGGSAAALNLELDRAAGHFPRVVHGEGIAIELADDIEQDVVAIDVAVADRGLAHAAGHSSGQCGSVSLEVERGRQRLAIATLHLGGPFAAHIRGERGHGHQTTK